MGGRPDYSEYVAHFTSEAPVAGHEEISAMDPLARLANILEERKIRGTGKWWGLGGVSAAFTECPWASLLDHATMYSPYALGFTKARLWAAGGAPAIYMRSETLRAIKEHVEEMVGHPVYPAIANELGTFYTPIERQAGWKMLGGREVDKAVDYSQEREWRVPGDFEFAIDDIQFLILESLLDAAKLPTSAIQAIGEDRILSMSNYRRIEDLWPAGGSSD
jgi:hypothetical protein